MKLARYDSKDARVVLIGMITDRSTCARISAKWQPGGLFENRYENLIGGWCVKHFREYETPPGKAIQTIFDQWSEAREDKETVKLVEKFLVSISDEYERNGDAPTSDYLVDLAGKYFNKVRVKQLMEEIEADIKENDITKAEERLTKHRRLELGVGSLLHLDDDHEIWINAFDEEQERPLIEYPGALGNFLGSEFARDSFIAFMGSAKRGKTWWLIDLAYRAVRQRKKVMYFEAGDLSESQLIQRLGQRALRRPRKTKIVKMPTDYRSSDDPPEIEERQLPKVTPSECFKAWQKVHQGSKNRLKVSCHPNGSLRVVDIANLLHDHAQQGWIADVVVIDYADILAKPLGVVDNREATNENWKHMRRISQELHCLVVTATQADASSYEAGLLRRKNFSDDRRKHDHVTAMIGINATDDEKSHGVYRLNFLDRRNDAYNESHQVYVAGCLDIGCPVIKSVAWQPEENENEH